MTQKEAVGSCFFKENQLSKELLRRMGLYFQCSKTCGGGTQTRSAHCVDERGWPKDESDCKQSDPPVVERPCGTQDCPKWVLGELSPVCFELYLVFHCLFNGISSYSKLRHIGAPYFCLLQ
jgi:hypothetical protein